MVPQGKRVGHIDPNEGLVPVTGPYEGKGVPLSVIGSERACQEFGCRPRRPRMNGDHVGPAIAIAESPGLLAEISLDTSYKMYYTEILPSLFRKKEARESAKGFSGSRLAILSKGGTPMRKCATYFLVGVFLVALACLAGCGGGGGGGGGPDPAGSGTINSSTGSGVGKVGASNASGAMEVSQNTHRIPEPATLSILAAGIAGVGSYLVLRRRRRS
jgi:hypothetical protein